MENYKTNKRIKELSEQRDSPRSWRGRLNNIKMSVLPKLIYRVNVIPRKISTSYFGDVNKLTLRVIWRSRRP